MSGGAVVRATRQLEILFLLEEHAEADDGAVDEETAYYRHDHGLNLDEVCVGEDNGERYGKTTISQSIKALARVDSGGRKHTNAHNHKEASEEAPEVEDGGAGALDEIVGIGTAAADPVGDGGDDIGGDDEERVVDLPEGAGQDDEEEADGEDEGEGDDGLEAGGRHRGRDWLAPGELGGDFSMWTAREGAVALVLQPPEEGV